ncbi:MAG: hypothetical protein IJE59_04045 [Clostridia bacterium]|nr:hypothetical protein [Clostridia bacterium]
MIKTIIKEAGIVLLLLIAVALILGIIFYEYIPSNKTVPIKVEEYALSEDIKNELKESVSEGQNIIKTFYIDSSDLELYEATKDYNKGKPDPFADYTANEASNTNNTTNNNANSNNINSVGNESQQEENKNEVYITTPGKNY